MKWPPSEFWAATPYDCLLAAGGMASIRNAADGKKLSKRDVLHLKNMLERDKLKNGKS